MKRMNLISLSTRLIWSTLLCTMLLLTQGCGTDKKELKFGIITDLHFYNAGVPDVQSRLEVFLKAAEEADVDFVIQLGDFCFIGEPSTEFIETWEMYPRDKYNVLGNHDMDICSKEEFMAAIDMPERYYSFERGDWKFLVLDANNLKDSPHKYIPYANSNYYVASNKRAFVDPEQIEWLKTELANTDKKCIIFSHQSLEKTVNNRTEIQQVLEDANESAGYKKVVAAFSGHDHTSYKKEINGISYVQVNSATSQYMGSDYTNDQRYSKEMYEQRPSLIYSAPYKDGLYAIVDIDNEGISIDGVQSEFLKPTPQELYNGMEFAHDLPLIAEIKDMYIPLKNR